MTREPEGAQSKGSLCSVCGAPATKVVYKFGGSRIRYSLCLACHERWCIPRSNWDCRLGLAIVALVLAGILIFVGIQSRWDYYDRLLLPAGWRSPGGFQAMTSPGAVMFGFFLAVVALFVRPSGPRPRIPVKHPNAP